MSVLKRKHYRIQIVIGLIIMINSEKMAVLLLNLIRIGRIKILIIIFLEYYCFNKDINANNHVSTKNTRHTYVINSHVIPARSLAYRTIINEKAMTAVT